MSLLFKISWVMRALVYKVLFGRIAFPSYIGAPLFLFGVRKVFISRRVRIFPHARIEVHGNGRLSIGENVAIGQGFHVTCRDELSIGKGTLILPNVLITDIDHDYQEVDVPALEQPDIVRRTSVGDNCLIGMGARILAGTILGRQCVVGANSVVRGVFPDYCVIVGIPGKVIKRFNEETQQWERC